MNSYFRIPPDLRDLNYAKYVDLGDKNITNSVSIILIILLSWMLKV